MGFEILKPSPHTRPANTPFISVAKKEINLNTAFVRERGWRSDKKYTALLMRDTDTGKLCIDFHDGPFPSSFAVRWRHPSSRRNVAPYAAILIPKGYTMKPGRYGYKFDGRLCRTEIDVVKVSEGE